MARRYKRGDPVVYYDNGKATPCFFGGKMGAYRVLSSTPDLESGWGIPLASVADSVFPAPNRHGCYPLELADKLEYRRDHSFQVAVYSLRITPDSWITATEYRIGSKFRATPLTASQKFPTLEAALTASLVPMLRDLGRLAAGAPNGITAEALNSTSMKSVQRHAQLAIYELLHALPSPVRSDIIMLLMGSTNGNG
ncbi:hypothetical protein [Burkholderia ubonensis]|uniref:hypothetical protein n=1 Tax=Burkholderia ubonensis TaxID=101571 RepID=UPI000A83227E|nr:hypothetical protein [Burkholderia ubonensis]